MPLGDKRSRQDLDLLLLALLRCQVDTPYRLLATAGLSPGATIPALRRLERAGLARRGKPGSRGRTEYQITSAGRHHLQSGWRSLLDVPGFGDIEAIFRTAALAILCGADKKIASTYLRKAAAVRSEAAKLGRAEVRRTEASLSPESGAAVYAWLQATHGAARVAMEANLLRRAAANLVRRI